LLAGQVVVAGLDDARVLADRAISKAVFNVPRVGVVALAVAPLSAAIAAHHGARFRNAALLAESFLLCDTFSFSTQMGHGSDGPGSNLVRLGDDNEIQTFVVATTRRPVVKNTRSKSLKAPTVFSEAVFNDVKKIAREGVNLKPGSFAEPVAEEPFLDELQPDLDAFVLGDWFVRALHLFSGHGVHLTSRL
jgi:hypothetical protein